jgi:diguanylate cyclase (GGDEF)-like protein/PAS domain S-box-containing protein
MSDTGITLTATYDVRLVMLSIVIAIFGSYIALDLAGQVLVAQGWVQKLWLIGGMIVLGISIWAMHFIAMLAYQLPIPIVYDFTIVFVSMAVAIAGAGAGLFVVTRKQPLGQQALVAGTLFVGFGIVGLHMSAMSAMKVAALSVHEPKLMVLSAAVAIGGSGSALWLAFHSRVETLIRQSGRKFGSVIFMGTAIVGMHYLAMAAVSFQGTNQLAVPSSPASNNARLAVVIGIGTLVILILTLLASFFGQRSSTRIARAEAQRQSEERFRSLVQNASDVIVIVAADCTVGYLSPSFKAILGYEPEARLGKKALELVHPEDLTKAESLLSEAQHCPGVNLTTEFRLRHQDGCWRDFEVIANNLLAEPSVAGIVATCRDITERKRVESELHHQNLRSQLFAEMTLKIRQSLQLEEILQTTITEVQRLLQADRVLIFRLCSDGSGIVVKEAVVPGWPVILGQHLTDPCFQQEYIDCYRQGRISAVADLEKADVQPCHVEFLKQFGVKANLVVPILQKEELWGLLIAHDCASPRQWSSFELELLRQLGDQLGIALAQAQLLIERKQAEKQLLYNACHDALTGLPNRALFMNRLEHALEHAERHENYLFAVLFLDLDRFKVINDSLGHLLGDQLLVAIANRLEACLRPTDTAARLGGDEFTLLLEDIRDVGDAIRVAERIQVELTLPFALGGQEVFTSASIGIALSTTGYNRPEDLLRDADIAMYRAKALGKMRYQVFDTGMHARAVALLQLETELRQALERQELRIYYQPIVSLTTGRITGFEGLVRWQHPERGLLYPLEFMPVAIETGLIVPIDQWVVREACRQTQQWQELFLDNLPLTISVNLCNPQFSQPELLRHIKQVLQETKLDANSLKLEITENIIMENEESATARLLQLRALGIQLCIDDFGTGYSSLGRLHHFPIDVLKIDCSFVSKIGTDRGNLEITETIVTLAHKLGVDVTAEGVETPEQLAQLRKLKCEYGQGYFFSEPLDSKATEALMMVNPQW